MIITGKYPNLRLRRNRKYNWTRRLIQESNLSSNDLILPIFVTEGNNKKQLIKSMPGVYRYSVDRFSQIIDKAISGADHPPNLIPIGPKILLICSSENFASLSLLSLFS